MAEAFWLANPVPIPFFINDPFNSPRDYANGKHEGIDLRAVDSAGRNVNILAAQRGTVDKVAFTSVGYGHYVRIQHEWADGSTYVTWYCHMSTIDVSVGDFVQVGQKLGVAGTTGNSTGVHLHLTLQHIGHGLSGYIVDDVVDPTPYFTLPAPEPYRELMFVSDETVPDGTILQAGQAFTKTWKVRNSGTLAWGIGCKLVFLEGAQMGGPDEVALPDAAPGEELNISLDLLAPGTAGRFRGTWKASDPDGKPFEFPIWVEIVTAGVTTVDDAKYLADLTVPDGTIFEAGESFLKTWKIRNTGSSTWNTAFQLGFFSDEQMGAPSSVPVTRTLPGEDAEVSVTLVAPAAPGSYKSTWRMRNPSGVFFGEIIFAMIKVESGVIPLPYDQLIFVSDVTLANGALVEPGLALNKIWRVRNGGNTNWKPGYTLNLVEGEAFGSSGSMALPEIAPGSTAEVSISITAPQAPGRYRSVWRPQNESGKPFEQDLILEFEVAASGPIVDEARFVSDVTIPDGSIIQAGASFQKVWRIRNAGTTRWDAGYELAFFAGEQMTSQDASGVTAADPGDEIDVMVNLTAPLTPGSFKSTWRMRNPSRAFFGDDLFALISVPTPQPPPMDNQAVFVEHETVKPGTIMKPGQGFIKGWVVRNTGKSTWSAGYSVALASGPRMGGPESSSLPLTEPQRTAHVRIQLVAPTAPGSYLAYWRLRGPDGKFFGPRLAASIRVK